MEPCRKHHKHPTLHQLHSQHPIKPYHTNSRRRANILRQWPTSTRTASGGRRRSKLTRRMSAPCKRPPHARLRTIAGDRKFRKWTSKQFIFETSM